MILFDVSDMVDVVMCIWNVDGSEVEVCGNVFCVVVVLIGKVVLEICGGVVMIVFDVVGVIVDL